MTKQSWNQVRTTQNHQNHPEPPGCSALYCNDSLGTWRKCSCLMADWLLVSLPQVSTAQITKFNGPQFVHCRLGCTACRVFYFLPPLPSGRLAVLPFTLAVCLRLRAKPQQPPTPTPQARARPGPTLLPCFPEALSLPASDADLWLWWPQWLGRQQTLSPFKSNKLGTSVSPLENNKLYTYVHPSCPPELPSLPSLLVFVSPLSSCPAWEWGRWWASLVPPTH